MSGIFGIGADRSSRASSISSERITCTGLRRVFMSTAASTRPAVSSGAAPGAPTFRWSIATPPQRTSKSRASIASPYSRWRYPASRERIDCRTAAERNATRPATTSRSGIPISAARIRKIRRRREGRRGGVGVGSVMMNGPPSWYPERPGVRARIARTPTGFHSVPTVVQPLTKSLQLVPTVVQTVNEVVQHLPGVEVASSSITQRILI